MPQSPPESLNPALLQKLQFYAPEPRARLMMARGLIFQAAIDCALPVPLLETLKWGQLAYLPAKPNIGTTIRLDITESGQLAAYFHCQTTLVDTFRQLYSETFSFSGNRALLMSAPEPLPVEALKHCFGLALTYHIARRRTML